MTEKYNEERLLCDLTDFVRKNRNKDRTELTWFGEVACRGLGLRTGSEKSANPVDCCWGETREKVAAGAPELNPDQSLKKTGI